MTLSLVCNTILSMRKIDLNLVFSICSLNDKTHKIQIEDSFFTSLLMKGF